MLIYLLSFLSCLFFHYFADKSSSKVVKYTLIFIPLLWLSLLAGLRDFGVGTDTEYYSEEYFKDASRANGFEDLMNNDNIHVQNKGYLFLNYIGAQLMSDISIEWFLTEFLILFCTYAAVIKLQKLYRLKLSWFSLLYLFAFYNVSLNIMRQMCAISICLLCFAYYMEKRKMLSVIFLMVATTFHTSAAIFALTYFYDRLSKTNRKGEVLLFAAGGLFIGISFYYELLELLGNLGVFSEIYMDRYGAASDYEGQRVPYAFVCVSLIIFWGIYCGVKRKIIDKNQSFFLLLIHGTFSILMMLNLLANTLIRISFYFYALDLVYMAYLISSKRMPDYYKILLSSVIIFQWAYNYMYLNGNATYPYKSSILGI